MGMSYDAGVRADKSKAQQMHQSVMREYQSMRQRYPDRNFPEQPTVYMYQQLLDLMISEGEFD